MFVETGVEKRLELGTLAILPEPTKSTKDFWTLLQKPTNPVEAKTPLWEFGTTN